MLRGPHPSTALRTNGIFLNHFKISSAGGVLKFRHNMIFRHDIFLSAMQDPQMVARILTEKSVNRVFYFAGIIIALPRETQRDENYPATIFLELVSNRDTTWARYHDIRSTAISSKAWIIARRANR